MPSVALRYLPHDIDGRTHIEMGRAPLFVGPAARWLLALKADSCMEAEHHGETEFDPPIQRRIQELRAVSYERLIGLRAEGPVAERHSHRVEAESPYGGEVRPRHALAAELLHELLRASAAMR